MRSIRIFAKNMGDPYYEPTIVVHDNIIDCGFYFYYLLKSLILCLDDCIQKRCSNDIDHPSWIMYAIIVYSAVAK